MASKRLLTTLLKPRPSMTGILVARGSAITSVLYRPPFLHMTLRQSALSKKYSSSSSSSSSSASATTQPQSTKLYNYESIKSLTKGHPPTGTLIDVREPAEFAAGAIPTAVNIPIASSPDALTLSPEDFEDRFGFAKPGLEEEVVFYCKAGIRSSAAAQVAVGVGYRQVGEYRGSWVDWERREKGV